MNESRRCFLKQSIFAAAGTGAILTPHSSSFAIAPIQRGMGARMKLSFAAYSYRKYLAEEKSMTMMDFLDECAKLGLSASEPTSYYFPPDANDDYFIQFKRKAFLLGLDISGTAIGNTYTHPAGPERDKNLALTKRWIDNAALMGAPCIRIFAGTAPKGVSEEQARKNCVETIQEACAYAARRGVYLALENHGGIVSDAKGMLAIVKAVESDWFGVNLDTGNFHTDDPYKDIAETAPYAVNVQVKVEMSNAAGKAIEPDFERIVGMLGEAGYRGYVALEYEAKPEPKDAVPRYLERLHKIISKA
ncbi:MAG: sugar phosphate isomerase/epimerase family protein [Candidatus Omnitrophota bacterium]